MTTSGRRLVQIAGWGLGAASILWFFFGSLGAPEQVDLADGAPLSPPPPAESAYGSADQATTDTSGATAAVSETAPPGQPSAAVGTSRPNPPVGTPQSPAGRPRVEYAIGLHDLEGLAPDTPSGTRLQLWVAWDPPLVKEPRVQRLVDEVVLEKVIPPTLPEGPHVAVLSLRPRQVPRLLYGDLWGRLSVVMLRP